MDERSEKNLVGVHPDLVKVVRSLPTTFDFKDETYFIVVTDGLRTLEEQQEFVKTGASGTLNSRHLTGHAVDISIYRKADGKYQTTMPVYKAFSEVVLSKAKALGVKLTWGGNWSSPKDGYHYQLAWDAYPLEGQKPKVAGNSKTIAAATVGVPIAAYIPEIFSTMKGFIGNLTEFDGDIAKWVQFFLVALIAGFIIYERVQKMRKDGE